MVSAEYHPPRIPEKGVGLHYSGFWGLWVYNLLELHNLKNEINDFEG
jgi:hypothetical protein